MFRFKLDAAAILAASIVIGGSLINLAREVSRLSVVVDGLHASVDIERDDRRSGDNALSQRQDAMQIRIELLEK